MMLEIFKLNKLDNKERKCSTCNDSGVVYYYNKDGDVTHVSCPKCADE